MSDQKDMIDSLLGDLAAQISRLEPGDLMAYGEVLAGFEQMVIISDGAGDPALPELATALKKMLEGIILDESADHVKGLEVLSRGVALGQALLQGETDGSAVGRFISGEDEDAGEGEAEPAKSPEEAIPLEDSSPAKALLDELASQVMLLEPGDLMAYGETLVGLEKLLETGEGPQGPALINLATALRDLLQAMVLGDISDHEQGLESLTQGITLGQGVLRGESAAAKVEEFVAQLTGAGEAEPAAEKEPAPAGPEAAAEAAPAPQPAAAEAGAEAGDELVYLDETAPYPDDLDLLSGFASEAIEHLESIEVNTLVIEDDPTDAEALNAVFRPFHTIKGVSGFLNLGDINHLAHALENLLDQARSGSLIIDSPAIDVVLSGVDHLRQMIEEALASAQETRPRRLLNTKHMEARIQAVLDGAEPPSAPVKHLGEIMVEKGMVEKGDVDKALAKQQQTPKKPIGEILVHDGAVQPHQVAEGLRTQKAMGQTAKTEAQTVKIDTAKLDNLLDMVGELVIAQSMIQANPNVAALADRKLHTDMGQLARITTDLQKSTMSMRMVPIKQTFQKMVRVVRDTAKKAGKEVRLELRGEGTEIDRNMVEKFYDPLMHMVRNSVDHGVEPPEERVKVGKPREGVVVLSAYHQGGNVCVEIVDDGRGLDRKIIAAKAVERGLIENDNDMSDSEVFGLIMQAGFSTAEKVTEISGRGVGMDVVQKTMDALRGKINIASTLGKGSTFTIALPLTLAIIDGMVVEVGNERFILPTVSVAESLRPAQSDYFTVQRKGEMIMIRGNLLPLVRLHQIVEVEPHYHNPWEGLVVVVEHNNVKQCLLVDGLVSRQEVVIKSLGKSLKDVKVLAGGAIMGDGRVGLILDIEGIFKSRDARMR